LIRRFLSSYSIFGNIVWGSRDANAGGWEDALNWIYYFVLEKALMWTPYSKFYSFVEYA
jgi:hypothetical protein